MSTQKKTIKVFMFLLPALVTLLGYAAFHDMLFKERPCLINCGTQSPFSDNEKLKKWLAFLESLRDNPFASNPKGSAPTALDLAFLQNKFANKHGDYLQRYKQIISDLTNPTVVKEVEGDRTPPIHIAQLSDPNTTSDTNSQTFVSDQVLDDTIPPVFLVGPPISSRPPSSPYIQPPIIVTEKPTDDPTTPDGGPTGPIVPGPGGKPPEKENPPISNVPVPKAVYLLLGLALAIVTIRFKFSQRT